jgi:hypothetical protein
MQAEQILKELLDSVGNSIKEVEEKNKAEAQTSAQKTGDLNGKEGMPT